MLTTSVDGITSSQRQGVCVKGKESDDQESPDMTPLAFFLWGFVKDRVYVPPFPANLPELRDMIREAVVTVTPDMLIKVWDELAYRLDVCRVTNGAHIEHL
ncbi:hypothetical protein C0J52_18533 [Blattella germanica]|nr:hypothetical protein C0J52_18533 [Blattella germanica]